jgi:uncharacterized Zn finger protein (UPF0148 family)
VWFLLTGKSRTKAVSGGEVLREHCPVCKRTTRFIEVEVEHAAGVWFVDLISDKERKFHCTDCGETFDRVIEEEEKPALTAKPAVNKLEALAAEQRRRDASKAHIAAKIDDELAELKRRMGR